MAIWDGLFGGKKKAEEPAAPTPAPEPVPLPSAIELAAMKDVTLALLGSVAPGNNQVSVTPLEDGRISVAMERKVAIERGESVPKRDDTRLMGLSALLRPMMDDKPELGFDAKVNKISGSTVHYVVEESFTFTPDRQMINERLMNEDLEKAARFAGNMARAGDEKNSFPMVSIHSAGPETRGIAFKGNAVLILLGSDAEGKRNDILAALSEASPDMVVQAMTAERRPQEGKALKLKNLMGAPNYAVAVELPSGIEARAETLRAMEGAMEQLQGKAYAEGNQRENQALAESREVQLNRARLMEITTLLGGGRDETVLEKAVTFTPGSGGYEVVTSAAVAEKMERALGNRGIMSAAEKGAHTTTLHVLTAMPPEPNNNPREAQAMINYSQGELAAKLDEVRADLGRGFPMAGTMQERRARTNEGGHGGPG